mgnify:CR=1 FL=1
MENKTLVYIGAGLFALLLLGSILATAGVFSSSSSAGANSNAGYASDTPQECRPPEGQDIDSWKEHLGHHENTKYCLEYYK